MHMRIDICLGKIYKCGSMIINKIKIKCCQYFIHLIRF